MWLFIHAEQLIMFVPHPPCGGRGNYSFVKREVNDMLALKFEGAVYKSADILL